MKVFALWVYWINCVFYICVATATYINDSLLGMRLSTCSIENNVQIVLDTGTFHIFVRDSQPIPFTEARWSPNGKIFFLHESRTLKALGVPSLIHVSPWTINMLAGAATVTFLRNGYHWRREQMHILEWELLWWLCTDEILKLCVN